MDFDEHSSEVYRRARQKGKREYNRYKLRGESGHATSLDGILKDNEIVGTISLGLREIPLKKIVGTYYHSRRTSFSKSFLPLESDQSEFGQKWCNLYSAHISEGIRDPIKVYEYLNYYYVMEGNKRVSVLKYVGAVAISAEIIRLIPEYDEGDESITLYYAFMEFYTESKISDIWFSQARRFARLLDYLMAYSPVLKGTMTKYDHFMNYVYLPFREVYHLGGGQILPITTGDAFMLYAKLYGIPDEIEVPKLKELMPSLIKELSNYAETESLEIQVSSNEVDRIHLMGALSSWIVPKKLKVGFVYARDVVDSGWTYSHDLGRKHIEKVFEGQVSTGYIDRVPESAQAYEVIKEFAQKDYDVVFTTSEVFRHATIKCAMENKKVKFFNCSGNRPYVHMTNYFGRTYEPRFLAGVVAGGMTQRDLVGYTATDPNAEVLSSINAFLLGMRLVNPRAKLLVMWTGEWNNPTLTTDMSKVLIEHGVDVMSNKTLLVPRRVTWDYGVYAMLCQINPLTAHPINYLAAPIWNWGQFYEKMIASVLNGTYQRMITSASENEKPHHFWWGLDSGVMDLYLDTKDVPSGIRKLVHHLKKDIINGQFHPFSGPIYDNQGVLKVVEGEVLSPEAILSMDWLVEGVIVVNEPPIPQ